VVLFTGVVIAMMKLLSGLVLLNVLVVGVAQVQAKDGDPLLTQSEFSVRAHRAEALAERVRRVGKYETKINKMQMNSTQWVRRGPALAIPELDANAAGAAAALLLGGAFILVDRKKRLAV